MTLPLIIMDIITRINAHNIDLYNSFVLSPTLFSLAWIILILSMSLLLKKNIGKYKLSTITSVALNSFITDLVNEYNHSKTYYKNILKNIREYITNNGGTYP